MTTMKSKPRPERCAACGAAGTVGQVARLRRVTHRGVALALPATLALTECSSCHELWLDDAEADRYSAAVDAAYDAELRRRAIEALDTLVGQLALLAMEPKKRVAELERFWTAKKVRAPKAKAARAQPHRRRAGA